FPSILSVRLTSFRSFQTACLVLCFLQSLPGKTHGLFPQSLHCRRSSSQAFSVRTASRRFPVLHSVKTIEAPGVIIGQPVGRPSGLQDDPSHILPSAGRSRQRRDRQSLSLKPDSIESRITLAFSGLMARRSSSIFSRVIYSVLTHPFPLLVVGRRFVVPVYAVP